MLYSLTKKPAFFSLMSAQRTFGALEVASTDLLLAAGLYILCTSIIFGKEIYFVSEYISYSFAF